MIKKKNAFKAFKLFLLIIFIYMMIYFILKKWNIIESHELIDLQEYQIGFKDNHTHDAASNSLKWYKNTPESAFVSETDQDHYNECHGGFHHGSERLRVGHCEERRHECNQTYLDNSPLCDWSIDGAREFPLGGPGQQSKYITILSPLSVYYTPQWAPENYDDYYYYSSSCKLEDISQDSIDSCKNVKLISISNGNNSFEVDDDDSTIPIIEVNGISYSKDQSPILMDNMDVDHNLIYPYFNHYCESNIRPQSTHEIQTRRAELQERDQDALQIFAGRDATIEQLNTALNADNPKAALIGLILLLESDHINAIMKECADLNPDECIENSDNCNLVVNVIEEETNIGPFQAYSSIGPIAYKTRALPQDVRGEDGFIHDNSTCQRAGQPVYCAIKKENLMTLDMYKSIINSDR
tara:strand:+ start:1710 stop:2942 length:1233 start_codon:yes stop_codon:yes gene_type:complete